MWTEKELEYIRENESYLEKTGLPLLIAEGRDHKFSLKLNIALAVLRNIKFKFLIGGNYDKFYRMVYLAYETANHIGDNGILLSRSIEVDKIDGMDFKAFKEFMVHSLLEMRDLDEEVWVKLVLKNLL